jgi:hypothetical protein
MDKLPAPPALAAALRLLEFTEPLLRRVAAARESSAQARDAIKHVKGAKSVKRMKRATRVSRSTQERKG